MVITLNIQGASPEEIREACKQFAEMGNNSRITITPEDLGVETLPPLPASPVSVFRKSYTQKENDAIITLHDRGYSWDEIATYLGRKNGNSIRTQYCTYRKQMGIN